MTATTRRHPVVSVLVAGALFSTAGGAADLGAQARAAEPSSPRNPFARHVVGVEFGAGLLGEAWNLNADREWLLDISASAWWAFATGRGLVFEFHNARVFQTGPEAFVQGFSPLVRWRMLERGNWRLYAEVGPGISWSDRITPPRGTKFNYLFQGGFGAQRGLGASTHLLASLRFLHLSNNGREGRGRNPDIDSLGLQTGLLIAF